MAAQQKKSSILGKLGNTLKKAFDTHKNDETEFSRFGNLPAGINNGIAQIVEVKFDTYKKGDMEGKVFFYAAGVVVLPKSHAGIPVEGLRTSIMEPICDTPSRSRQTASDHVAWILNEMRKLGVDTSTMDVDDLEPTAEALKEAQPYFRFDTWAGKPSKEYPDPKTNHRWNGVVEYTPEEDDDVEDNTDETATVDDDEPEEVEEDTPVKPSKKPTSKPTPSKPATSKAPTAKPVTKPATSSPGKASPPVAGKGKKAPTPPPVEFDDQGDIDTLLERANDGEEEAQNRLAELAIAQGYSEEDIEGADSWDAVKAMAEAPKPEDAEEVEEEEQTAEGSETPEVGEVWDYTPKGSKKPVSCEVTAVNVKKDTVTLKNLSNPKLLYKDVPFSELSSD